MSAVLPLALALAGTLACAAPSTPADPAPAPPARRMIAVGDVHGDLDALRAALRLGGLLDEDDRWAGGATVLVQVGDVLDRGDDEREILALLDRLGREARDAGGRVVTLLGNHEVMNVAGDLRYVTAGGFEDWAEVPHDPADPALAAVPDFARGRVTAFRPGGPAARALADRAVTFTLDGTVFVHGGVLPPQARAGLDGLDAEAAAWLRGEGPQPGWAMHPDGPLWTRVYGQDPPDCQALGDALERLGAARMVIGHTPQAQGIAPACDGRLWRVDVGMARAYGGRPQVLELRGDAARVLGP